VVATSARGLAPIVTSAQACVSTDLTSISTVSESQTLPENERICGQCFGFTITKCCIQSIVLVYRIQRYVLL